MRNVLIATVLLAGATPVAAVAQTAIEGRVDRLEREMRAVQRKVFPGGNGQYVQPEITPPAGSLAVLPGTPASSPVTDLDARVVSLERQMQSMTGSIEQAQYKLRQLEDAFTAYKRSTDARLTALEQTTTTIGADPVGAVAPVPKPAAAKPAAVLPPATTAARSTTPPAAARPAADPARAERLAAIDRPATGDAAEDGYNYGYRLWQSKLYPEAEVALKAVVDKYPKHRRASYAQNLLGRSYLDEGRPSLASLTFYDSFKNFPDGERAPQSLYYLAQALMKLNNPTAACKVYAELDETFATKIDAQMRADIVRGRAAAKCK